VQVNDEIDLIEESQFKVTIRGFVECCYSKGEDKFILEKILAIPLLPDGKRQAFESFL